MARAIKFRFWRDGKMQQAHQLNAYDHFNFAGDGEVLMQYTGLLDKNGKEIYEGDIVSDSEETFEVYFGEIGFEEYEGIGWILKMLPENDDTNFWLSPDDSRQIEVVGNVHENPDLLK